MRVAEADEPLREGQQAAVLVVPVEPRDVVVLAVGVVVAALGAADLVAAEHHRHTLAEQQRRHQVPLLALAQRDDRRVVRLALGAVVPGLVVVGAVLVALAVRLVVLAAVADEVPQREAVVRGDEVDAGLRLAAIALEQVCRPGEPVADLGREVLIPLLRYRQEFVL